EANGFDVWYDEKGLSGGSAWVEALQREVQARDVFVLVVTPEAMASQWCQEEIQLAMATRRTMLPVLHKPTQVAGFLLTRQWVDVVGLDPSAAAQRVTGALMYGAAAPVQATPKQMTPAPQIVPSMLQRLGFVGRTIDGVAVITPPLCDVSAGPFLMGSDPRRDPEAHHSETPQRTVELQAFRIARYPLTVAEYGCAVHAGALREPPEWERQAQRPDHPVVEVS